MSSKYIKSCGLLIVDVQNDFTHGSLAVPAALEIIPKINDLIARARTNSVPVLASRDWHPADHSSFSDFGGQWPAHCVAGTAGAELNSDLNLDKIDVIFDKGCDRANEQYSALQAVDKISGLSLQQYLQQNNINNLIVCGLALDFCVYHSVAEAQELGVNCELVLEACRGINAAAIAKVLRQIQDLGALVSNESQILA
jgi:nicotinamidase/pyrazinamidase